MHFLFWLENTTVAAMHGWTILWNEWNSKQNVYVTMTTQTYGWQVSVAVKSDETIVQSSEIKSTHWTSISHEVISMSEVLCSWTLYQKPFTSGGKLSWSKRLGVKVKVRVECVRQACSWEEIEVPETEWNPWIKVKWLQGFPLGRP